MLGLGLVVLGVGLVLVSVRCKVRLVLVRC